MIAVLGQMLGVDTLAGVLWLFVVAFFDNLLGTRKILAVVAALTLWCMIDETSLWNVQFMHSMINNLNPSPNIAFQVYAVMTVILLSGIFVALFSLNCFQLYIVKYLIRRWRLKERCGRIHD
jgi:MFS superfamily sulfate permease-like transporter